MIAVPTLHLVIALLMGATAVFVFGWCGVWVCEKTSARTTYTLTSIKDAPFHIPTSDPAIAAILIDLGFNCWIVPEDDPRVIKAKQSTTNGTDYNAG